MKRERPDAVLILTTNYLFDRAVILAARGLGIKSYFLMHGIRAVGEKSVNYQKKTPIKTLYKKRWAYAIKFLLLTIPNYFLSGLKNNWKFLFRIEPYSILFKLFLKPHHYILFPPPSSEIHCDIALVWGKAYKEFFCEEYGYPENRIKVVGHPPLDSVFDLLNHPPNEDEKKLFFAQNNIPNQSPYCVYLEDGSVEQGANGWTTESRIQHLEEIATLCNKAEKNLVIKLHPATLARPILEHFYDTKWVKIINNIDLNKLLYWAESAIGLGSTTNDIAIIMKKPLFLPGWGNCNMKSKAVIERQPSAILCPTPNILSRALVDSLFEIEKSELREEYIRSFITHTDGKSLQRIVDIIATKS